MSVNVGGLSKFISSKTTKLELNIPEVEIKRNDVSVLRNKIASIDPKGKKEARDKQINFVVSVKEN